MTARTILICMDIYGFAQHPFLSGILSVVRNDDSLNVLIDTNPGQLTHEKFLRYLDSGIAAAIICETGIPDILKIVRQNKIPMVVFGSPKPHSCRRRICYVMSNDTGIGIAGAKYLYETGGFRSFSFISERHEPWSDNEERGFSAFLEHKHRPVSAFHCTSEGELVDFLAKLAKPAAVMAADDLVAIKIVNTCRKTKISIPKQLVLIGVHNDEVLCNGVSPSLSSIGVDHEKEGRMAINCLLDMLRDPRKKHPTLLRSKEFQIVERESSATRGTAAHLIEKALAYIDRHINQPLSVNAIALALGISRRLLEIRFREIIGCGVNAFIVDRRLDHYRKQLLTSKQSASSVARTCGFSDMPYLTRIFKAKFSCTPGSFCRSPRAKAAHQS